MGYYRAKKKVHKQISNMILGYCTGNVPYRQNMVVYNPLKASDGEHQDKKPTRCPRNIRVDQHDLENIGKKTHIPLCDYKPNVPNTVN